LVRLFEPGTVTLPSMGPVGGWITTARWWGGAQGDRPELGRRTALPPRLVWPDSRPPAAGAQASRPLPDHPRAPGPPSRPVITVSLPDDNHSEHVVCLPRMAQGPGGRRRLRDVPSLTARYSSSWDEAAPRKELPRRGCSWRGPGGARPVGAGRAGRSGLLRLHWLPLLCAGQRAGNGPAVPGTGGRLPRQ